ncbi:chitin-binding protein [Crossiella equi]|uniref:Chitin-binding protein n=1 Tax=Crossiella equi TaxID=130796 RepID=A0ABS5ALU7_9PSEU|nr:lytic polysaccharide monooxygenase [Crossiella equi]MBP2477521.1 chitin-binding protein [Crossiella equi]
MRSDGMVRALLVSLFSLALMSLSVLVPATASAHGYTNGPNSRANLCKIGTVKNCGPIQWEPQSVEGPKGFPARGPVDGTICAGGLSQFAQLDDPRGGAWPTTKLTAGASRTFSWYLTAPHATTSFRYFITKNGWTGSAKLTRAALDPAPFLTVNNGGARPPNAVSHTGTVPAGKTGRHLVLAVWDIADTGNAFYQCIDVNF